MRIPLRVSGGLKWIVLKPGLFARKEDIASFIEKEITAIRLAKENGLEIILKQAQRAGLIAYIEEER